MFRTDLEIQTVLFVVKCASPITYDKHQEANLFLHDVCQDSCHLPPEER